MVLFPNGSKITYLKCRFWPVPIRGGKHASILALCIWLTGFGWVKAMPDSFRESKQ
jgi:hypothetical protein